jgi:hypothetical protein
MILLQSWQVERLRRDPALGALGDPARRKDAAAGPVDYPLRIGDPSKRPYPH